VRLSTITAKRWPGSSPCLGDHRELCSGDDDGLACFERLFELARGLVDVFHHAKLLLELGMVGLKLAVEHAPVSDDHD